MKSGTTSATTKPKSNDKATSGAIIQNDPSSGLENRLNCIATAAYYKAEARQFEPSRDLNDWLEAEEDFKDR